MALTIDFCGEVHEVADGQTFTIGREGDLAVDDNQFLHRRFLHLHQQANLWAISNVGSQLTATVSDHAGHLEAFLAPGAWLPLVFGTTFVSFSAGPTTYSLSIVNSDPPFASVAVQAADDGDTTIGATHLTPDQKRLIVALAEPRLNGDGKASVVLPSSCGASRLDHHPLQPQTRQRVPEARPARCARSARRTRQARVESKDAVDRVRGRDPARHPRRSRVVGQRERGDGRVRFRRLVLITAVAVLVGCSAGSDAAPVSSSSESSSAKVVAAPPVTGASDAPAECVPDDSPGTVRLWHVMGGNVAADLWADFEAEFEAQSDIDLEVTSFGGDIEIVKKLAETDPSDWPDIIDVSEQTIRTLVDSEKFVPPADCDPALGSDLIPIVRATYTVDGELVALPFGVSTLVLVYDRAEYEKAGLDPTAPPRTFDDLLAASSKIVDSGVSGHGLVMSDHCGDLFMEQYPARRNELQSVPGNGRSDRAAHVDYRSPEISADFTALKEAIDAGHVQYIGPNGSGFDDLAQLSPVDGDATMTIHTSAALGDVIDLLAAGNFPGAVLGVSALPGPADGALVGGNALWLAANGDAAQQGRALTWIRATDGSRSERAAAATALAGTPRVEGVVRPDRGDGCFGCHCRDVDRPVRRTQSRLLHDL
jgi:ABC-type glycerol-3-phosphate transport system substrate-binding protein